jgi:hypothetical protein
MSVDDYIGALPPDRLDRVTRLRSLIHEIAPDVVERIEWKMPVLARGERWVAIASQKSYISVYLNNNAVAAAVVASDPLLKGGKACVNIPDRAELPIAALGTAIRDVFSA